MFVHTLCRVYRVESDNVYFRTQTSKHSKSLLRTRLMTVELHLQEPPVLYSPFADFEEDKGIKSDGD